MFLKRSPIDLLVLLVLLSLTIALFAEVVGQSGFIPSGVDLVQHYSREAFNRRALQETWVPLWNPYVFSGFPVQADPQAGVFYPPSMFLRLFSMPTFLTWSAAFHVWLFGVGGYVLCRTIGVGRPAASLGAVGLLLGGIVMPRVYAGHLDVLRTVSWLPLVLAAAMKSFDRNRVLPTVALVVTLSLEVLAGFLQIAVYTFVAVGLYAAFSAGWPPAGYPRWTYTRVLAMQYGVLVALVLGITAFQLLPSAQLIVTAGRTSGMPYGASIDQPLSLGEVATHMIAPHRTGEVETESWENTAYVGWLLAFLAPVGCFVGRRRRRLIFVSLIGALALLLGIGNPLYWFHYLVFPMFRIPGRLFCFWSIGVAVCGAVAIDWLVREKLSANKRPHATCRSFIVLLVAGLIVVVDGISYGKHFVRAEPIAGRFATSVPFKPTPHGRVLSLCENRLQTSEISALGIPSVDGYNSYFLGDYAKLAQSVRGDDNSDQSLAFPRMAVRPPRDIELVSALNVTDILSCEPLALPGVILAGEGDGFYLYKNTGAVGRAAVRCEQDGDRLLDWRPTCSDPETVIEVLAADRSDGRLRVQVELPEARTLVLAEPFYPERRAWVDGVPTRIQKANIGLSAVKVRAGLHTVELRYVPFSLVWGVLVAVVTLLLWLVVALRDRRLESGLRSELGGVGTPTSRLPLN